MNITTTPKERNVGPLPCDILVGAEVVGDLTPRLDYDGSLRWHACIRLPWGDFASAGLIQGHGASHADAIANALESGKATALRQLRLTQELASRAGYQFKAAPAETGGAL